MPVIAFNTKELMQRLSLSAMANPRSFRPDTKTWPGHKEVLCCAMTTEPPPKLVTLTNAYPW